MAIAAAAASGCSTTPSARGSPASTSAGCASTAVPEGRVVHPNTPITVVEGPLAAAQLLETPLLNQLNFATLIATKAARVVEASHGRPVLEFGMRRAAAEGADAASRAADRRRRRVDVQRRRRLRARPHAGRHPRPLHGPAVHRPRRGRAGRVRRLRRRLSRRHAAARRHRRHHGERDPQRHRHVRAPAPCRARAGRDPPRFRRPRLPRRAVGAGARPGRVPRHRHRAVEPARRADDLADHVTDPRRGPPDRRRP